MIEAGRNDPCPCGSGKKYKKCCLVQKAAAAMADLNWERLRRTEGEVIDALVKYIQKHYDTAAIDEAWNDFTVWTDLPLDPEDTPEVETIFMPWLIFNWDPDPAVTDRAVALPEIPAALCYLTEKGGNLDSYQRRFISEVCAQPYSFFQVTDTVPGRQLMLRDIMLQQEITVLEREASTALVKGQILFTRVITIDGDSIMLGGAPVITDGRYFSEIVDLREEFARSGPVTRSALHKYNIELRSLYFALREQSLHPAPPRMENTDGDPLQLTRIQYRLTCPVEETLSALLPLTMEDDPAQFREEGEYDTQGNLTAIDIPWLKEGNEQHEDWDNTVLGHIEIKGDRMTVEVNSQSRAELIQTEIERLLGSRAELEQVVIDSLEKLREGASRRPAEPDADGGDDINEELMANPDFRAQIEKMAAAHWRSWLDQQLPVLDNETPREAAKTVRGRERLEALLLEIEGGKRTAPEFRPDMAALRRELGM